MLIFTGSRPEKIFRENLFVLLDRIWKTKTFLMPTKNKSQFCIHLSSDRICIDTISYIHSRQFCLTYLETKDSTRTGRTGLSTGAFRFFVGCTSNVPISNLFNRISKHLEMHRLIVIQSPCWWQVYTGASFSDHWKKIGCIGGRQYDEREKNPHVNWRKLIEKTVVRSVRIEMLVHRGWSPVLECQLPLRARNHHHHHHHYHPSCIETRLRAGDLLSGQVERR